jgi:two-component system NtrC family sensor kinase
MPPTRTSRSQISDRHYHGIRRTITLIILVVSITPLLALVGVAGHEFNTAYRAKVLAYLEQLVRKHARDIDIFLDERLANIRWLVSQHPSERLRDEQYLAQRLAELQQQHAGDFVDLGLVNREGKQVAYAGPFKLAEADYGEALWFQEAMGRDFYISDLFLGLRGMPHFIVAVKHIDPERPDEAWILRSTIDFMAFNHLVENIRLGRTGQAFIINRNGEFQTRPRTDLSQYVPGLLDRIWNGGGAATPTFAVDGHLQGGAPGPQHPSDRPVEILDDRSPDGDRDEIHLTTLLKNGDWALIYLQTREDAFASLYSTRNKALALLLISSLFIFAMAFVLSRRVAGSLEEVDRSRDMMNEKVIEAGKLASIGELAAGIAHEINNPVAIMVEEAGWVGDVLEEEEFGDTENVREIRRAIAQIGTQGKRCKQITHKLLSFARKTDPVAEPVALNTLIREVVELSGQHARCENIRIQMHLAPDLPEILASPSEMQQVLLNLINNAIDAIDYKRGGEVTIATRGADGEVILEVGDTGQGIPAANLSRVFDPFFTTKGVGKGTGLGLSICYGIVDKMGGAISVSSNVGVGTTFNIRFPAVGAVRPVRSS